MYFSCLSFLAWLQLEKEYVSQKSTHESVAGPMYLWDIARVNGISWDPTNEKLCAFVQSLAA